MVIETINLITFIGSLLGGVLVFIFNKINSEKYAKKYSSFKRALETHFDNKMRKEIINLVKNKSLTLEQFQTNFSNKLSQLLILQEMRTEYLRLKNQLNKIFVFFLIILISVFFNLLFPNFMLSKIPLYNISLGALIVGLGWFSTIYLSLSKLDKYMDRFYLGESIDRILEERLLKEYVTEN